MKNQYLLAIAVLVVVLWMLYRSNEGYNTGYKYGFVDTNPTRRVSDAFDSPVRSDVYEGLPLP
jgi:hypothetical protein|tara:strand:- start:4775 stop:4963 length:189 start_codon:yes stop_codon:yes gene_type:complete